MLTPYFRGLAQGFREAIAYPFDFFLGLVQILIMIGVNVFIWTYIIKTDASTLTDRLAYFLFANGLASIIGASGYKLAKDINVTIKEGTLTHYLLKPISPLLFIYMEQTGDRLPDILIGTLFVLIALFFANTPFGAQFLLFLFTLVPALVITISLNVISGSIGFWTTEAGGIKNVFTHLTRLFNGMMIPIDIFTKITGPLFSRFLIFGPFAAMSYTPTSIFIADSLSTVDTRFIYSSLFWTISMPIIAHLIWKRGLRRYEGTGI